MGRRHGAVDIRRRGAPCEKHPPRGFDQFALQHAASATVELGASSLGCYVLAGRPTGLVFHIGGVRREGAPPRLGLGRCLPGAVPSGAGLWLPCSGAPGGALARARPGVAGGGAAPSGRWNALLETDRRAAERRPSGADRSRHSKGAPCWRVCVTVSKRPRFVHGFVRSKWRLATLASSAVVSSRV